ncbi:MAG: DUF6273 domain-containing protein, partial [Lachnospiraceae bacterium]|nr:DUF6273 domain-containing protein [Lachnospiraceae bacterium]
YGVISTGNYNSVNLGLRPAVWVFFSDNDVDKTVSEPTTDNIALGSTIIMGHYEQDNNASNGEEDIEWIVLSKRKDSILITSKYILDCMEYDIDKNQTEWQECSLREWMNNDFLYGAFSEEERSAILKTNLWNGRENSSDDYVFPLSIEEIAECLTFDKRISQTTVYSASRGVEEDNEDNGIYWLRVNDKMNSTLNAIVDNTGRFYYKKSANDKGVGVRPALWIKVEKN